MVCSIIDGACSSFRMQGLVDVVTVIRRSVR